MKWPWSLGRTSNQATRARVLEDLARSFATPSDFEALRTTIARRFLEITGCDAVSFCELQPARSAYVITATAGDEHADSRSLALSTRGNLIQWLQVNQDILQLPDPRGAHEYLESTEREELDRLQVRACLPLLSITRLAGVLFFQSRSSNWKLPQPDADLLLACGRQAGLSYETVGRYGEELSRIKSMQQAQRLAVAGQLAASVAHEIRNPLTAIRSTMQFLLSSGRSWEQKQPLIEEIICEVDRIERTVSGILTLSRPSQLEVSDVDLLAVVEAALQLVQAYGESQRISLVSELGTGPLMIRADPRELRIVFVNILMNACQAIEVPGKVTVRSEVTSRVEAGRTVRGVVIEITDTGLGMSPEVLSSVFEPFVTTKKTGTGLGLPISLEIVTRHGGTIDVSSQKGFGTSVAVWIPLRSKT